MNNRVYKINGHKVEFVVSEENRVVVAMIHDTRFDASRFIENVRRDIEFYVIKDALMQKSMKSVAKCMPEDKFDVDFGKRIAYEKLKNKYWTKYTQALCRGARFMSEVMKATIEEAKKHV